MDTDRYRMHDAKGRELIGRNRSDGLGSYVKCGVEGQASIRSDKRRRFFMYGGEKISYGDIFDEGGASG